MALRLRSSWKKVRVGKLFDKQREALSASVAMGCQSWSGCVFDNTFHKAVFQVSRRLVKQKPPPQQGLGLHFVPRCSVQFKNCLKVQNTLWMFDGDLHLVGQGVSEKFFFFDYSNLNGYNEKWELVCLSHICQ